MKKLIAVMGMVLLLVGCGENPVAVLIDDLEQKNEVSFKWEGMSGTDWLYAKEKVVLNNGKYTSVEKTYSIENAKNFKSNLAIVFTNDNYDNNVDYSKHPPQVWISKTNGTIRIIGNKDKYFYISFLGVK